MNRNLLTFILAAGMAGLAGCAANQGNNSAPSSTSSSSGPSPSAAPESASGSMLSGGKSCDAQPTQRMVGQAFSDSASSNVLSGSGSSTVRVLKPGQVMTLEYNPSRVNIIVDGQGKISAIRCG
ncbi:I78 family peptidase inhibitor [Bordetella holmesii]|uniref:Peptidase inhibitor I78 family protein n=1 Tax=Bordetella holmesii CDC-H585-BH TaxID=1331206 RepID=A0A158MBG5_9BORD|nr:I78 family peptidase inhibitor [Bordetella holmesii]AIT28400.1 peptidase inhibitor I78 family protein [Bordetella holmesii 44057]EWM41190.1 peptidase inhibitor I78 family protein [Bordetella holmesii 35009]EWM44480.1 peptidase inhibitor I78 family protein [Bordetella holmesii 41130]AMD47066.1 hypothetical protein H558_17115 [Bordetella holmesii H558]AMD47557.1 peptidase inhibitor I78 family protein [Bordetella holmesii F627]